MKSLAIIAVTAAAGLLGFSAAAQEAPETNLQKLAVSGQPVMVWKIAFLNPDCSSMGASAVRVLQPPQNGVLEIVSGKDFTSYPAENVRSKCNDRPTDAVLVKYKSNPGYTGPEEAQIEYISPIGTGGKVNLKVTVK